MYLTTSDILEAVSDATATTTEPIVRVDYVDITTTAFTPGRFLGSLNGTTDVTITAAPAASTTRQVKYVSISNIDTVAHAITVKTNDGSSDYIEIVTTMQAGETLVWTPELGWSNNLELLNLFAANNVFTGTNEFFKVIAGDPGTEGSGIDVNGTTYESVLKASDIGGSNVAQMILHRHSTTLAPVLVSARSHSDTSGHAIVQDGDQLFRLVAVGWDGVDYARGAEIVARVDGTPGSNDMPTAWDFKVSPDGSQTPVTAMTINPNGTVGFKDGNASAPSIGFLNDTDTGMYLGATGEIGFSIGGSNALKINTEGTGFGQITSTTINAPTAGLGSLGYLIAGRNSEAAMYLTRYGTDGSLALFFNDSGVSCGSISISGSSTAYNTSSDYRLKENITEIDDATTRLMALKPRRFNFTAEPDKVVDGFMAHEAAEVVPEAVTGEKDAVDEDGNPEYQGIDQAKLVPLLTAALQDALKRIEALEAR